MKKKLLIAAGLAVIVMGIVGTQWRVNDTIPTVEIPTKKLPSPNGYDFYVEAGESLTVAPKGLDAIYDSQGFSEAKWKMVEAWLAQNATALKTMRQGLHYSAQVPARTTIKELANDPSSKFRSLARALVVECRVHSKHGRWGAATQSATDILKLAHGITQEGRFIDYLTASDIERLALSELERIRPRLNSDEATLTAKVMEELYRNREAHAEILLNEKHSGQALLIIVMKEPNWKNIVGKQPSLTENLGQYWQTRTTPRQVVFQNYSNYMDALIAIAKKPYDKQTQLPSAPQDFYNRKLAFYSNSQWGSTRRATRHVLSFVAMALHAHKLYHHRYPENLNALVPGYLKEIPTDPFGGEKPLRYRQSGDKYLLYSVGPDGKDDGGSDLIFNKEKSQKPRGRSELINSKGDIAIGSHWKSQQW